MVNLFLGPTHDLSFLYDDEEAVRVISKAKKWSPGKQRGRPVKVRMILPITFKLG